MVEGEGFQSSGRALLVLIPHHPGQEDRDRPVHFGIEA